MTTKQTKIHLAQDLGSFFEQELKEVARKQGVGLQPHTASYLSGVFEKFSSTDNYLMRDSNQINDETQKVKSFPRLAELWLEASTKSYTEQFFAMQSLGDFALFTRGFFAERISSTSVDADYYSALGEQAYERAGKIRESLSSERALNTYFELAENFNRFAELFAELADQSLTVSDKDLLRLYEKWMATKSHRIARMLGENGIIAALNPKDPMSGGDFD